MSVEQQGEGYSIALVDTLISLKVEIKICKENNNRLLEHKKGLLELRKSK